jgi:outer membrane protein
MTPNIRTTLRLPVLLAATAFTAIQLPAYAQQSIVKAGLIRYDSHSKTNGVTGIGIPAGADAEVGDATTFLLTYEYMAKPNVGIELVLGIPPKIKAKASGSVAFLGEVLSARNVAPTLLVNYHFGTAGDVFRPYIGLGLNYTHFTNITTPYGWDVKLSDSVGFSGHVGADYVLNKDMGLFVSLGRADVKSKLTATGAVVLQSTIDFRPWTYTFGASYKF